MHQRKGALVVVHIVDADHIVGEHEQQLVLGNDLQLPDGLVAVGLAVVAQIELDLGAELCGER